ncbi:SRPBCC family protein [Pelagibius marinus]|uniref:SRPBCC family protein n=1 Tax=Pelagibius marinus TaxID=2762760 RepID=UPI001872FFF6|nr:SRPBCC family protein [Pelagibius marinus]
MKNTGTLKVTAVGERDVHFERVFEAPPEAVFAALTQADKVKAWMGPHGYSLVKCDTDLTVGGAYRYVMRTPDGGEMGWGGLYREIDAPRHLVHTESFDDWPMMESVITTELNEQGGKTVFFAEIRYASPEARDAVLASGMEHGAAESYDRLAELLTA